MPTNRRVARPHPRTRFTPRIVEAFKLACKLEDEAGRRESDAHHGKRVDARLSLHRLLHRKPWEADILAVASADPPQWMTDPHQRWDWRTAHKIQLELARLAGEET